MDETNDKNEKTITPSVSIDGSRIRSVREAKKLTQLYVANVVGVTTDTISRWENNRYPSIKRDNAEKLAGALEVELAEILRREEPAPPAESTSPTRAAHPRRRLIVGGAAGIVLLVLLALFYARFLAPAPSAVRSAPHFAAPGEIVPVQIRITRRTGVNSGFILKEYLPHGWRLINAQPATSSSEPSGLGIKWLIPGGSASVTVSYSVQVPAAKPLDNQARLRGELVLPAPGLNRTEAVQGGGTLRIGPYHWADSNGDGRIDDDEIMPAYYICEEMKGFGLDWRTIEAIWSGKGYRWEQATGYSVLK